MAYVIKGGVKMNKWMILGAWACLGAAACSNSGSLDFTGVVNIEPGNAAGTAFSGDFAVVATVAATDCTESDLKTPSQGTAIPTDVTLTQADGVFTLTGLDVALRGALDFSNRFELGGADIVDRGDGIQNIQRLMRVTGSFTGKDTFQADGEERLFGQLNYQSVDCTISWTIASGIRKPA
jgi:hypothetical protein